MLAAYRELKNDQTDTTELDAHLEACSECRRILASSFIVGEAIRAIPKVEPDAATRTRMMQALAAEHLRYSQQAASAPHVPTPDFLKPYLHEQASSQNTTSELAAFSSADTGPIPLAPVRRRRPPIMVMGPFVTLGIAAMILMALMVGGLTSLLLLAKHGPVNNAVSTSSIAMQSEVAHVSYTTTTNYTHVVSAAANQHTIYYTAYNNDTQRWMLLQMDRTTRTSTPLLSESTTSQLLILRSSEQYLAWLQLDAPRSLAKKHGAEATVRPWSLHILPLATQDVARARTVLTGSYDQSALPNWVHTPVQGVWFAQNSLLVAMLDANGIAHLYDCLLDQPTSVRPIEIATATNGHVLTSPTANSDGTDAYWAEEWATEDGMLHSNIWTLQTADETRDLGVSKGSVSTAKHLFLSDGMYFHPQVVQNMLFVLSTASSNTATSQQATPSATATKPEPTATAINSDTASTSITDRIDPTIYKPQPDALLHGTLLALPLHNAQLSTTIDSDIIGDLQSGSDFMLWQSQKGYQMYDVSSRLPVNVNNALKSAAFLAINGDTAVWIAPNAASTANDKAGSSTNTPTTTFLTFNWPAHRTN